MTGTQAEQSQIAEQVRELVAWVGTGRRLTQTGRITLADARTLVVLLGTDDTIDPVIGDRTVKTKSSEELYHLNLLVHWARAAGFVRVTGGRLVPVKKHASLLEQTARVQDALFQAMPKTGEALLPAGWFGSLLGEEFSAGLRTLLLRLYATGDPVPLTGLQEEVWEVLRKRFVLDGLTKERLNTLRLSNDRDVTRVAAVLLRLSAVRRIGEDLVLSEAGRAGTGHMLGQPTPGEPVYRLRIELDAVDQPTVWRRVLVPASIRLDRLHLVVQAAMGWQNCHMHAFAAGGVHYGRPSIELDFQDEAAVALNSLAQEGDRLDYTYDFGDSWEHFITVERLLEAEASLRYPSCAEGAGACPPEDCGGAPGYADLKEALADPGHPEHRELRDWLGLQPGAQFDPARFNLAQADQRLLVLAHR
jgi:hypothetical protein